MEEDLLLGIFRDSDRITVVGKPPAAGLDGSDCWRFAEDVSDGAATGASGWSGVEARESEVSES